LLALSFEVILFQIYICQNMEPSIEEIPFNFHQMNSSILVDTLHISNDSDQIFLNNLRMEKTESFSANANMSLR